MTHPQPTSANPVPVDESKTLGEPHIHHSHEGLDVDSEEWNEDDDTLGPEETTEASARQPADTSPQMWATARH